MYDWVLSWGDSPYSQAALFVISLSEAVFFPIPPDVLLIPLVLGERDRVIRFVLVCTAGSIIGGIMGFLLGFYAWQTIEPYFVPLIIESHQLDLLKSWYQQNMFLVVFSASFSPIPYKVFTVASGMFASGALNVSFPLFLLACVVGRGLRFGGIGFLLWKFGKPIRQFLDRYFNIISLILIVGLLVVVYLFRFGLG